MTQNELLPAIQVLERRLDDQERKVNELLAAVNLLRSEAGMPPRPPGSGGGGGAGSSDNSTQPLQIQKDTFFGKKQQTAIREYLEMRKAAGVDGPAKPREIYDALTKGGFQYQAKDAETALVGLRALLRKRSNVFVKVGEGAYGLMSWYPDVKRPKDAAKSDANDDADDEDDEVTSEETTATDDDGSSAAA